MRSFGFDTNGRSLVANGNNNNNNNNNNSNNVPDVVLLDDGVDVKVDLVTYDDRDVLVANMIDQVGAVNCFIITPIPPNPIKWEGYRSPCLPLDHNISKS